MSIGNLTFIEAINELSRLMDPEAITKTMLESLVERVSVQDPVAGTNVTTFQYSGSESIDLHRFL
ncbi:hypothetical protein P9E76_08585 [Schinkia azotoformans]|uniref:Uncharacterized protein n=1 Tax=Schinkia azotoformans LMG 9581 TaxID=1131731 RepID=K6D3Q7_SCHAZ|nr:hypothetical protein [Schinkia azotoformans]EKN62894.1 hypothetical protein BAZO_20053 [Schinkia azotoformans LMG 9581]MEC1641057.1 hypothetical protein [Schinkia azotoformans]MEC1945101.1 hypothetical protein [Schinkia azotoformans]